MLRATSYEGRVEITRLRLGSRRGQHRARSTRRGKRARARRLLVLPALSVTVLFGAAVIARPVRAGTAANLQHASAASTESVPPFGHVFLIVGENKSLAQITASKAPYIVDTLEPQGAWFSDYNAIVKGSLADYITLTSGQYASCQTQGPCGDFSVPSIFSQVGTGNWMDWNESMPSNCYYSYSGSKTTYNAYKPGHNPALYYNGLPCSTYDVPAGTTGPDDMSYFNNDLATGNVPEYNFITPNECEDGYKWCVNSSGEKMNGVVEFDNFLQKEVPLIESSPAFGTNGIIFITFDESSTLNSSEEQTMMLVLGPQVTPGSYSGYYNHYSALRTIEDGLGQPCLANACTASDFPIFGGTPPTTTTTTTTTSTTTTTTTIPSTTSCPSPPTGETELSGNVSLEGDQTGWYGHLGANTTVARLQPPGGSYDGLWAMQVGLKAGTTGTVGLNNAKPIWVTSTTAGATYQGSVFVAANTPGEQVTLLLRERTSGGAKVGYSRKTVTLGDTGWHQITDSYTAKDSGDLLRYGVVGHSFSSSEDFLADCLSLWH